MKIGVFGTGMVGQALAGKLQSIGHDVMIGTRDPAATLAKREKDSQGNPPFHVWHAEHSAVKLGTLAEAARHGELFFNALNGQAAVSALQAAGEAALAGKILIDTTNPLDFSQGFPPSLFVCNTESLAERIQQALPKTKVVKSLNTVNAHLMVDPGQLQGGDHSIFVSGNDADAKAIVTRFLREGFGWKDVIDLGDLTSARGTEMYLPLWVRLWGSLKTPAFSIRVVR